MPSAPNVRNAPRGPDKDVCYAEACVYDKDESANASHISDNVWRAVRPPSRLGANKPPMVSARKLEVIRAQLNGKVKGLDEGRLSAKTSRVYSSTGGTKITRRTKF